MKITLVTLVKKDTIGFQTRCFKVSDSATDYTVPENTVCFFFLPKENPNFSLAQFEITKGVEFTKIFSEAEDLNPMNNTIFIVGKDLGNGIVITKSGGGIFIPNDINVKVEIVS